jgi:hypothetical protein
MFLVKDEHVEKARSAPPVLPPPPRLLELHVPASCQVFSYELIV